jgi:hypothetical protein
MAIDLRMGSNEIHSPPQKVRIKPTKTGALITTYKNNTTYGYITLNSEEINSNGEVKPNSLRTCMLRAEIQLLKKFVDRFGKEDQLPGRIVVKEFLEGHVPENYMSRLNKNLSYEDSIAIYVKRASKEGIELTLGGERILRFTEYDGSGNVKDELIPNELIDSLTAKQKTEQIFEDTRFKLPTYEDVSPFSKRTRSTQIIQDKSPSAYTEKTNQSDAKEKNRFFPEDMTIWEYVKAILTIILFVVGGLLLIGEALGLIDSATSNEWRRP